MGFRVQGLGFRSLERALLGKAGLESRSRAVHLRAPGQLANEVDGCDLGFRV